MCVYVREKDREVFNKCLKKREVCRTKSALEKAHECFYNVLETYTLGVFKSFSQVYVLITKLYNKDFKKNSSGIHFKTAINLKIYIKKKSF